MRCFLSFGLMSAVALLLLEHTTRSFALIVDINPMTVDQGGSITVSIDDPGIGDGTVTVDVQDQQQTIVVPSFNVNIPKKLTIPITLQPGTYLVFVTGGATGTAKAMKSFTVAPSGDGTTGSSGVGGTKINGDSGGSGTGNSGANSGSDGGGNNPSGIDGVGGGSSSSGNVVGSGGGSNGSGEVQSGGVAGGGNNGGNNNGDSGSTSGSNSESGNGSNSSGIASSSGGSGPSDPALNPPLSGGGINNDDSGSTSASGSSSPNTALGTDHISDGGTTTERNPTAPKPILTAIFNGSSSITIPLVTASSSSLGNRGSGALAPILTLTEAHSNPALPSSSSGAPPGGALRSNSSLKPGIIAAIVILIVLLIIIIVAFLIRRKQARNDRKLLYRFAVPHAQQSSQTLVNPFSDKYDTRLDSAFDSKSLPGYPESETSSMSQDKSVEALAYGYEPQRVEQLYKQRHRMRKLISAFKFREKSTEGPQWEAI